MRKLVLLAEGPMTLVASLAPAPYAREKMYGQVKQT